MPFFIDLQNHLAEKKFKCPKPVPNREGQYINTINNKPCVIISFLDGNKVDQVTINHCKQVGEVLSSLHKLAEDFDGTRANGLHQAQWRNLFQKCKKVPNHQYKEIIQPIEEELDFLDQQWPSDLPKGIIHADVFHDNVFFKNNIFSGLIDFYFSCNDFFAYEIALTINAWCFNNNGQFDFDKFQSLIAGYQIHRVLNGAEKKSMSILLRGATMRILLTRLHDQLYHPEGAFVIPKNPLEYFLILKFIKIISFLKIINMIINVYTDGACSGNPGIGGWGAVILINKEDPIHIHGGSTNTTNNQMELKAAIEVLKYFPKPKIINVITDSKYVKDGIESWIHNWKKNG